VITDRGFKYVDDIYKGIDDINAKRSDEFQFNLMMLQDKLKKINEDQNNVTFQSFLSESIDEKILENIKDSILGTQHLAWVDSLKNTVGGRWLEVAPKSAEFTFSPEEFRAALRYRLYLSNPLYIQGSKCNCKKKTSLDHRGHHLATGCGCDGTRHNTHDSTVTVMKDLLSFAGIKSIKEEKRCFQDVEIGYRKRPDLSVLNLPGTNKKVLLDISITSPIQNINNQLHGISRNQALNRGRLSQVRYNDKCRKYKAICERSNLEFVPIIFESTGALHKEALKFFHKIIDIMAGNDHKLKHIYNLFWTGRLACKLQKCIAYAIISKSKVINGNLTFDASFQMRNTFVGNFPVLR
jgi:hypothetical protein